MSKLKGNSSLSINNIPEKTKIGLIDEKKFERKSFYISKEAIDVLKNLNKRFSEQGGRKTSESAVIEMALFAIEDLNLRDLIK